MMEENAQMSLLPDAAVAAQMTMTGEEEIDLSREVWVIPYETGQRAWLAHQCQRRENKDSRKTKRRTKKKSGFSNQEKRRGRTAGKHSS